MNFIYAEDDERAENGKDKLNLITRRIMGAAIEAHRHLGPGLLSLPTKHVQRMSGDRGDTRLSSRNRFRWSTKT